MLHVALSPRSGPLRPPPGARCPFGPRVGWLIIVLLLGPVGWLLYMLRRGRSAAALALVVALAAGAAQAGEPPASVDGLIAAYRAAHLAGDADAMMGLFHWPGVDDRRRAIVRRLVEADLARDLADITVLGPDEAATEFMIDGSLNRANLPVVGHLLIKFGDGGEHYSLHMIGTQGGAYYIALAVPGAAL